jgi:hypothetical protein
MMNLRGSVLPWYLGGGVARKCEDQGASCKWLTSGFLRSVVARCGGGSG